jgi:hypothetical protein
VWHASVSPRYTAVSTILPLLWTIAEGELHGVGDATRGEWREVGDMAVHLRRRLTDREMRYAAIEAVVDVRGTDEYERRIAAMVPFLPAPMRSLPMGSLP